jgi:hypothetical protein
MKHPSSDAAALQICTFMDNTGSPWPGNDKERHDTLKSKGINKNNPLEEPYGLDIRKERQQLDAGDHAKDRKRSESCHE